MSNHYLVLPVSVGLIVGISIIILFSLTARHNQYDPYRPAPNTEQQELVERVVEESKEARAFLAKFPLAKIHVAKTSTCINGCLENPPLVKNGTRIEFNGPQAVEFPSRAFHGLRLTVDLDLDNNIESIKLTCYTGYEHGTSMGSSIFNPYISRLQEKPNWADYCS
jgi:hypothetical protein